MPLLHKHTTPRRIGLIVTDHEHRHHQKGIHRSQVSSSALSVSNNTTDVSDNSSSSGSDRDVQPSSPQFMKKTQSNFNYMADKRHHIQEPPHGVRHMRRVSFDDLDISAPYQELERKGSVPMIGSVVYYKNRHHKEDGYHHQHQHPHHQHQHHEKGKSIPLPTIKIESDGDTNENFEYKSSETCSTINNNSDSETISSPLSSDCEDAVSNNHYNDQRHKLFRNFSLPEISFLGNVSTDGDEFNAINSKIKSHLKKNHEKFNKFLHDEHKKNHYNNTHFHIPGLDPEISSSSAEASQSNMNLHLGHNSNKDSATSLSSQLQSRSSSMSKLEQTGTHSNDAQQPPVNNRHRRRLTCAMIFTRPKVVEI